jgi:hypothetical protein
MIDAQCAAVEDVLQLIRDQSVTMRDPRQLSDHLDTLVRDVEQTEETVRELEAFPAWARELSEKYYSRTISMFVLHGNVRDLVISYGRSGGLSFATPDMKADFDRAMAGCDSFAETIVPAGGNSSMPAEDRNSLVILKRWVQNPGVASLQIPLPDETERLDVIAAQPAPGSYVTPATLAKPSAGLKRVQLLSLIPDAFESGGLLEFVQSRCGQKETARRRPGHPRRPNRRGPHGLCHMRTRARRQDRHPRRHVEELPRHQTSWSRRPIAVIVDEADAQLGNRSSSGDSGVGNRVFAQIAQFHGQHRAPRQGDLVPANLPPRPAPCGPEAPGPRRRAHRPLPPRHRRRASGHAASHAKEDRNPGLFPRRRAVLPEPRHRPLRSGRRSRPNASPNEKRPRKRSGRRPRRRQGRPRTQPRSSYKP